MRVKNGGVIVDDDKPLYLHINYPDTRKRLNINYNNEVISIIVEEKLEYSSLLGLLIDRLQIDRKHKPLLRLVTADGRRVLSLRGTYHDQQLTLSISNIKDQDEQTTIDQQQQEESDSITNSISKQLNIGNQDESIQPNQFLNESIKLSSRYMDRIIIGESYPYRIQVLFSNPNSKDRCYVFIIDNELYDELGIRNQDVIVYCAPESQESLEKELKDLIKSSTTTKCALSTLIDLCDSMYEQIAQTSICKPPFLADEVINIFPSNYQLLTTLSSNSFINQKIYKPLQFVQDKYGVSASKAKELLFKFKWNLNKLKNDVEMKKMEISNSTNSNNQNNQNNNSTKLKFKKIHYNEECSICTCQFEPSNIVQLTCNHVFCKDCMSQYINSSVGEGNGSNSPIECMWFGCRAVVDSVTISTCLVGYRGRIDHFQNMLLNDVIYISRGKWCAQPNCHRIFSQQGDMKNTIPFVPCSCGENSCLMCGKNRLHWPTHCTHSFINSQDNSSYLWMAQNTTPCPKCRFPIDRSAGCNHMNCIKCHHEFCYACGSNWTHKHYSCSLAKGANRVQRFANLLSNGQDTTLIQTFLLTENEQTSQTVLGLFYCNLLALSLASTTSKTNRLILEEIMYWLNGMVSLRGTFATRSTILTDDERKNANQNIQKYIPRLIKISKAMERGTNDNKGQTIEYSPERCLRSHISLNGQMAILDTLFVNTQLSEFRQQINQLLIENGEDDIYGDSFRIYNRYGGLIKSTRDIIYDDHLFIAHQNDQFKMPTVDDIRQSSKSNVDLDEVIQIAKKSNQKQQQINNNKDESTTTTTSEQQKSMLVIASLEVADLMGLEDEQAYQLVSRLYELNPQQLNNVEKIVNFTLTCSIGQQINQQTANDDIANLDDTLQQQQQGNDYQDGDDYSDDYYSDDSYDEYVEQLAETTQIPNNKLHLNKWY